MYKMPVKYLLLEILTYRNPGHKTAGFEEI